MATFQTISSGIALVFGAISTIILYNIFKNMYNIYLTLHPKELKIIFYSFGILLFSGLSLFSLNVIAFIFSIDTSIAGIDASEIIHGLSFLVYNLLLAIGLALFVYNEYREEKTVTTTNITTAISTILLLSITQNTNILLSIIICIEALLLMYRNIPRVRERKEGLFTSKLWIISLGLIFIGRIIYVLNFIPFSYLALLYFDLFAFTTLFILQLEIRVRFGEGEIEI
jgi:hypothetical protein